MELITLNPKPAIISSMQASSRTSFIEANTVEATLEEIRETHVIPVFCKDNEPTISHTDFIESMIEVASDVYQGEKILQPGIRLSHPIKGRVPDARDKPASQLEEWEKTLYYERMMFAIELPGITESVSGNNLSLVVGGVKAYSQDNLYSKKGSDEHFKIFAGFQNRVCTNLCIWSDALIGDLKVKNLGQLRGAIRSLLEGYNIPYHLHHLQKLPDYSLTENQFAHLIGRCRMYQFLPAAQKRDIAQLLFGDQQINTVCRDFYRSESFCRSDDGDINLWKLYNLFTEACKSTYIDQFLDRSVNAFDLTRELKKALDGGHSWFLS